MTNEIKYIIVKIDELSDEELKILKEKISNKIIQNTQKKKGWEIKWQRKIFYIK